ncbi:MAG: (Fe-S)-binding protein [Chloroflexi bacterium]|nr:(Fe-S)-binding protein [Chloroflexota bacterium]
MLDQKMLSNIRESGIVQGKSEADKRDKLLRQDMGFRVKDKAGYALIAGCFLPFLVPDETRAFGNLLDYLGVDYTLLPKEYCCGNLFYRHAVEARSDEDMEQADVVAREFLENNARQARQVGATKIISYCVGCDIVYHRLSSIIPEEIMWYPSLLARLFRGGQLALQADYYAGCHNLYRRVNSALPDLESTLAILKRIDGLELHELNHRLCCTRPKQMEPLVASIKNRTIITPCYSCVLYLQKALKGKGDYRVVMLPQVLWAAVSSHTL